MARTQQPPTVIVEHRKPIGPLARFLRFLILCCLVVIFAVLIAVATGYKIPGTGTTTNQVR